MYLIFPKFQPLLVRAWRAIIARAGDFSPEASSNTGLSKQKLALRKGSPKFGCQTKCDGWKFPRRGGRGIPERTHREMLDVVGVDCERRLWLVTVTFMADRTDTGCWQPNRG